MSAILSALRAPSLEVKLIAAALALGALLAGVLWLQQHERQIGAAQCEAKAAQADAARTSASAEQFATNEHTGQAAAQAFETQAGAIAARQPEIRHAIHSALSAPAQCPAAAPVALGDLLIPGAAVDGLRRAAASGSVDPASAR